MDVVGRGGYNPDMMSPDQPHGGTVGSGPMMMVQQQPQPQQQQQQQSNRMPSATPTMQQRIKALGVATPLALSSPVRR